MSSTETVEQTVVDETDNTDTAVTETEETESTVDDQEDSLPEWARKKLTKANTEAANYRSRLRAVEKQLAEAQTPEQVEAAVAELKTANARLERDLLVEKVARQHKLPDDLAARLQGNTLEELTADAKALAKYAVTESGPDELRGGLDPSDNEGAFDPVKAAREARLRRY